MGQTYSAASARLYHGEVGHILEALTCMHHQYAEELRFIRREIVPMDPEEGARATADFEAYLAVVGQCQCEYDEALAPIERALFERWAASDNAERALIGTAALSGDFTPLAF